MDRERAQGNLGAGLLFGGLALGMLEICLLVVFF
jgi:hypothetical protein